MNAVTKYGHMTVARHKALRDEGVRLRVFLDGVDVSNDCKEANDIEGWALLYKRNEKGQHYIDRSQCPWEAAMETKLGLVEFRQAYYPA